MSPTVTLASASPRRQALLAELGVTFAACAAAIDERPHPGELPVDHVRRLATEKAAAVRDGRRTHGPSLGVVLGSDTVVVQDAPDRPRILGKPQGRDHATEMLSAVRDHILRVVTGVALLGPGPDDLAVGHTVTELHMGQPSDAEIAAYVASGEADDKAGGLAVQGGASAFVRAIDGCWTNVVGLPLCLTAALLGRVGVEVHAHCRTREGIACPELPVALEGQA